MLRDPVERIVSHYHYVLAHPQGAGNARAVEGVSSLDEYVRSSVFARIVNNGQTRLLGSDVLAAGEPADAATLERAKAFLDRPDVVVGVQERFDESLLVMVQAFGWGLPAYRRENVTASRPRIAELAPATVDAHPGAQRPRRRAPRPRHGPVRARPRRRRRPRAPARPTCASPAAGSIPT